MSTLKRTLLRDLMQTFPVEGGDTQSEKKVLERLQDPLAHLLRNSNGRSIEIPDVRAGEASETWRSRLKRRRKRRRDRSQSAPGKPNAAPKT